MFEFLFRYSRAAYERGDIEFLATWPGWLLPALAVAAAGLIVVSLSRRRRTLPPVRLVGVGVLQLAMLAAVLFVLLEPALVTDRLRDGENAVALLLDTSESMGYGPGSRRIGAARAALESAAAVPAGPAVDVKRYEFDSGVRTVDGYADARAVGTRSGIAAAVTGALREARFVPLAAVIVASDGADTAGGIDAGEIAEIAAFGVPVHTIAVGREAMPEDLEIADLRLPSSVLPGSTVAARVAVRHDAPGLARLKVFDGDELLAAENIELGTGTGTTVREFEFVLDAEGPHQLEFVIDPLEGEQELRNNRRTELVTVADEDYSVLYFEGEPRWEYKFLRRAVTGDENLRLASLLRVSPNKYYRQGLDSPEQLADGFPSDRAELFAYDALIIGSVEAALLSADQQRMIAEFVGDRGGSLLMLAGPRGLGNGGWGQSSVADALPARLPAPEPGSFFRRRATVGLTPQGSASRMLRLAADRDDNLSAWQALPEVADYQLIGALKPAASVFVTAETERGNVPLLVTQPYGRGRAFILATSGTWRWQMSMPVDDLSHEVFWRQLVRSMVANAPQRVSLDVDARPGAEGLVLRAEFRGDDFAPLADIGVTAVISRQDGETLSVDLEASPDEPGVYRAAVEPGGSGIYYVEAVAARRGAPVETARGSLHYTTGQAEYFGIRGNRGVLDRLSQATGGRRFEADELDALPELLRYGSAGITEKEYRRIWDIPAIFLLLLLLKVTEWLLRRRWSTI